MVNKCSCPNKVANVCFHIKVWAWSVQVCTCQEAVQLKEVVLPDKFLEITIKTHMLTVNPNYDIINVHLDKGKHSCMIFQSLTQRRYGIITPNLLRHSVCVDEK